MKKKKWLPMVLGILLLAGLLVVYFVLKNHNEAVLQEEEAASTIEIMEIAGEDVTSICFTLEGKEVTFVLEEDTWKLESDAAFKVDGSTVEALITAITSMTADRKLENVTDLAQYGLEQPLQKAVLKDASGNTCSVSWGNTNSSTGSDYIYLNEDTGTVYTVLSTIGQTFGTSLEDYQDVSEETQEETEDENPELETETTEPEEAETKVSEE